jgi:hypothetical protein
VRLGVVVEQPDRPTPVVVGKRGSLVLALTLPRRIHLDDGARAIRVPGRDRIADTRLERSTEPEPMAARVRLGDTSRLAKPLGKVVV